MMVNKPCTTTSLLRALLVAMMFLARSSRAFLRPLVSPKHLVIVRGLSSPIEIASPQEVLQVFQKPKSIIIDVRSLLEIDEDGFIMTIDEKAWLAVPCTPAECPTLAQVAKEEFPDKDSKL
jgi:hypothetical protein